MLDALNNWVTSLPTALANTVTMVLFLILLGILWSFPKAHILKGAPDTRWWRDLRIWGTVLIFVQLGIYALFR